MTPTTTAHHPPDGGLSLTEVLAKLTAKDAKEVETRTRRHRKFLTSGVVPQVAAGLVAAAEARPGDPLEFLAAYLIRCEKSFSLEMVSFLGFRFWSMYGVLTLLATLKRFHTNTK